MLSSVMSKLVTFACVYPEFALLCDRRSLYAHSLPFASSVLAKRKSSPKCYNSFMVFYWSENRWNINTTVHKHYGVFLQPLQWSISVLAALLGLWNSADFQGYNMGHENILRQCLSYTHNSEVQFSTGENQSSCPCFWTKSWQNDLHFSYGKLLSFVIPCQN